MPAKRAQRPAAVQFLTVPSVDGVAERANTDIVDAINALQGRIDQLELILTTLSSLSSSGVVAAPFFDTILTPTIITFGAAFDNWNPGTLGDVTLIRATSDATRNVQGMVGGVEGKVVCLLNVNAVGGNTPIWVHESGSATDLNRFHNSGLVDKSGGSSGACWYYYDGSGSSGRWRMTGVTT